MILAALGSAAAAAALLRLGGPWAAVAWLFAPTAVFTPVPYTEALFCAAAFWAWERARADRWAAAALLAAAACTLRVSGLFLVGALFVLAITRPRRDRRRSAGGARPALWLLLPVAVIGGVRALPVRADRQLDGLVHRAGRRLGTGVHPALGVVLAHLRLRPTHAFPDRPLWPPVFAAEIVSMAVGVLVVGWCLGRRLWAEASWVGIQVLAFSVSYWFFSVNRAILLWFPLWMMIGELVSWRPERPAARVAHRIVVALGFVASALLMLAWSWLYFTGNWAS